jgi:hypothetical protein
VKNIHNRITLIVIVVSHANIDHKNCNYAGRAKSSIKKIKLSLLDYLKKAENSHN